MPTRREMLFEANKKPSQSNVIPATVGFKIDKKKKRLRILSPQEKMLCALRKALTQMSDKNQNGCRYYIDNNEVQVMKAPIGSGGREGEPQSYTAKGRCKLGVCHAAGHKSSQYIEFNIVFRDTKDELGLNDVEFLEGTTIDSLPASTVIK